METVTTGKSISQYSDKQLARWKSLSGAFAMLSFFIGGAALLGWVLDNDLLKRVHPSLVTMKANAAVCLMLTASAVLLLHDESATPVRKRLGQICAVVVTMVGLLTLSEHLFGWNLGIDQLIFHESVAEAGVSFPGRMGVAGSLDFFLFGLALVFLDARLSHRFWLSNSLVLTVVSITVLVFLYYFYGIDNREPIAFYFTIALHTVVAFLSLCAALLLARPERGIVASFLGNSTGSVVARRLWPAILAIALFGWLENVGRNLGLFGAGFGTAAIVLGMLLIFVGLLWWTALSLNRTYKERGLAELALRDSEARLAALLEQLPLGVGLMDRSGQWLVRNSLLSSFVGETIPPRDHENRLRWRGWDGEGRLLDSSQWPSDRALLGETISPGLEMLYTTDQGKEIWTRVSSAPFRDINEELVGALVVVQDIDEEKRAAESRWRLAAIVDSSEDAVISKDLDGKIISWNSGAQRLFGYAADEVVGKSITILIPADRLHEEPEILSRIRRGERIEHFETVRRSKDGTLLDISLTVSPITDAQNTVIGVSKIARDITARRLTENRLDLLIRVSNLIRTLEDSNALSYAVAGLVGAHLDVRRCLFNETHVELDLEIVHQDYCDGVDSVAGVHKISEYSSVTSADMLAGKTVINCDAQTDPRTAADYSRIYQPNGERAYVAVPLMRDKRWVASLWVSDNRPRQWTSEEISLLQTVSERTWTAVEKLRIDKALRASEERLRLATEAAEMYAWEVDLKADGPGSSQAAEIVSGFLPDNLASGIEFVHADDRDKTNRILTIALENSGEFEMEYRLVNPMTNREVWFLTAGKVIPAIDQTPTRIVGVTHNVTRRKLAEAERERLLQSEQEARDAAEKANQLKDEFLATLSHELRNPLNVILGYSDLLLRMPEIEESARLRQMGEALRRNAQFQSQLINDLLDLSRLQTGKISLNRETVSLATIVETAVETVRGEALAKGVTIRLRATDEFLFVEGDRLRLQQIVWNLLNNAVKFTPSEGRVEISLSSEAENAVLQVEDTGQGIDDEFLPHVFEMFRQADPSNTRKHGGMGIGLALVKQLVQLNDGTVNAESEGVGKGSRFTVKLPLTHEPQTCATSTSPLRINMLAQTDLLVVDDSEDTVAMLEELLKSEGATVTTATSGIEALRIAAEKDFDMILSDISMPEMDGFEFLQRLRKIPGRQGVPVVAITGFGRSEDVERTRAAGFYSHLTKPIDLQRFGEVFQRLVAESKR